MLHPTLERHLQKVGADIRPQDDGSSVVHVPGADYRYRFYPPQEFGPTTPRHFSVSQQRVNGSGGWQRNFDTNMLGGRHTLLHDSDGPTYDVASAMVADMAFGHHTTLLPGHKATADVEEMMAHPERFHERSIAASQHLDADGLKHLVHLRNTGTGGGSVLSTEPGFDGTPHPEVLALAKELLKTKDDTVGNALADAVVEHHGTPDRYVRSYSRALTSVTN